MLKRFDRVVSYFDGKPFTTDAEAKVPLTVRDAIVEALGTSFPDEPNLDPKEKLKRFILAERIYGSGRTPTEIDATDLALVEALVWKRWPTFIAGFVYQYLEGEDSAPEAELPAKKRSPTLAAVAGAKA